MTQVLPCEKVRGKATAYAASAQSCEQLRAFTPGPLAAVSNGILPASLIRKNDLLDKLKISKSTLHAKLDVRSRYHDPSIPRPRYLERSRIPLWSEQEVNAWLTKLFDDQNGPTEA